MAGEINVDLSVSGLSGVTAQLYSAGVAVGSTIALTNISGTTIYTNTANIPNTIPAGTYLVVCNVRGSGILDWNGSEEITLLVLSQNSNEQVIPNPLEPS